MFNEDVNGKTDIKKKPLGEGVSLLLFDSGDAIIFKSSGKWLYPLFEVEDYLHESGFKAEDLFLHDRIAGRAAASLIVLMGFRHCFIETVSSHAMAVFKQYGVDCGYDLLVERIDCRTEDLITDDMALDDAYKMLRSRAGRLQGVDLDISNLSAGYEDKTVLKNLNLSLSAGDQIIITGDNGSGKSTLMKSLIGTVDRLEGDILIAGEPLASIRKIPSVIGYVNQSIRTNDFPITAAEVVSLGMLGQNLHSTERSYEIEIAMRRTGCFHLAGRNIHSLSGGEKQRVSLARCLAQKAGLILMDEPTSFLDRESRDEILDVLKNVVRRHMPTIILVSHDYEWIERLGWPVKQLKDGRLC